MRKFIVTIYSKKDSSIVESCVIESKNEIAIILKGRQEMLPKVRFDKRKHDIGYVEV